MLETRRTRPKGSGAQRSIATFTVETSGECFLNPALLPAYRLR